MSMAWALSDRDAGLGNLSCGHPSPYKGFFCNLPPLLSLVAQGEQQRGGGPPLHIHTLRRKEIAQYRVTLCPHQPWAHRHSTSPIVHPVQQPSISWSSDKSFQAWKLCQVQWTHGPCKNQIPNRAIGIFPSGKRNINRIVAYDFHEVALKEGGRIFPSSWWLEGGHDGKSRSNRLGLLSRLYVLKVSEQQSRKSLGSWQSWSCLPNPGLFASGSYT